MVLMDNFRVASSVVTLILLMLLPLAILGILYFGISYRPSKYGGSSYTSGFSSTIIPRNLTYTSNWSTWGRGGSTAPRPMGSAELLEEAERLCWKFMGSKMISSEGAVYSTLGRGYGGSRDYGVNHEVTAESIGLLMSYAVDVGDKPLFDREVLFLEEKLLSPLGICYWKLGEDLSPYMDGGYASSASIDDLRIVEALIDGYDQWGDERYIRLAHLMMDGIYLYEVDEATGILLDYYTWRDGRGDKAEALTLSYAVLPSLLKMGRLDERWVRVFNETLRVVLEGSGSQGLFHSRYIVGDRRYVDGPADAITELTVALNLADVGEEGRAATVFRFFRDDYLERGFISDLYTPSGMGSQSDAGVGAYSLLARLALKMGDRSLALKVIYEKILAVQDKDPCSSYYGAFMNQWPTDRLEANAYDNLQALLTLREAVEALRQP